MKRYLSLVLIFFCLSLVGCSTARYPSLHADLTKENWVREVDNNPMKWTIGADRWFLTGDPNAVEMDNRNAPYDAAISTMAVNVPDFTNIKINGDFQVQIFGTYGHNSVYVYGPNDGVRQVIVEVRGNTLCVDQPKKVTRSMGRVLIRIGINQLDSLIHQGCGMVEGVHLRSHCLFVTSNGSGHIYLSGSLGLQRVVNLGSGNINIFGATTPTLDIKSLGKGSVNVGGNVGIRSILHQGSGNVNIIGANSADLSINAGGSGKIGIKGIVNLREVRAKDLVRVYAYTVKSNTLYAYASNKARIGLAGFVEHLYVETFDGACFSGKYLCSMEAYARAHDNSHINISANNKIFAASTQNSSIYFFGSPRVMSQFVSGNGTIIPVWSDNGNSCTMAYRPVVPPVRVPYKGENISNKGEVYYPRTKWRKESLWERVK